MLPWFSETFGNAHSSQHVWGRQAAEAVEAARAQLAALIGADQSEVVFTTGATESNNLAIKGARRFARRPGRGGHIVPLVTEHKRVIISRVGLEDEDTHPTVHQARTEGPCAPA